MIVEIYDVNGMYNRSIVGDEFQCIANVLNGETFKEVETIRVESLINERAHLKSVKMYDVDTIMVTTSRGKVFDGDETSQGRILRAIQISAITGQTTTQWKLADNTIVEVTIDDLKEALALAGQEMSRIWLQ